MRTRLACTTLAAALLAVPAAAQHSGGDDTTKLVDEIRTLLDKGERERLADPWFLRDLREVLQRYDDPWRTLILEEDFSARGSEPPPPWRVLRGEFLVDWRRGLRAVVEPGRAPPPPPQQQQRQEPPREERRDDSKDVAKALIGALMQQALSGESARDERPAEPAAEQPAPPAAATTPPEPAFVTAAVAIPNAFAISIELSARPVAGVATPRLELGPYQGADIQAGYRLVHESGASPSFTLLSASTRRTATVDLVDRAIDLTDGEPHRLEWTRDSAGRMRISLDGEVLIEVTDRRFRDPFDGLAVLNAAGDFALRRVRIDGAR